MEVFTTYRIHRMNHIYYLILLIYLYHTYHQYTHLYTSICIFSHQNLDHQKDSN